ncbi:ATP-dependent DNA helicase DDX31-like isoform X2 [Artemia franciscana]|nr:hypothetical protein QYM36_000304 [Artemia franciscana]
METQDVTQVDEKLFSSSQFSDLAIHDYLKSTLEKDMGLEVMTEIQSKAIPELLEKHNACIQSQTGSGKTLVYAIPIIQELQEIRPKIKRSDGVYALIVLPTRELVLQTYSWFQKLTKSFTWIVPGYLIGGEKKKSEKARIRKGINILISSPGRLKDHLLHTQSLNISKLRFLILDEADRILDEGYEREISDIIEHIDKVVSKRQTVLLSATMSKKLKSLAFLSMKESKNILMSDAPETLVVPTMLHQEFVIVPAKLRLVALISFLAEKSGLNSAKSLVFVATQDMVDYYSEIVAMLLKAKDVNIDISRLHGSMGQKDRCDVFKKFKNAKSGVLICTDVAARGLDLPKVDWVLQFSPPSTVEEYVHRVGRTARVGLHGSAVIFLLPSEIGFVSRMNDKGITLQERPLQSILAPLALTLNDRLGLPMEKVATEVQQLCEDCTMNSKEMHELASKAYVSFVRFYATYPKESRDIFSFQDLHLGHHAKSFSLRDPPKQISSIGKNRNETSKRKQSRGSSSYSTSKKRRIFGSEADFDVVPVAPLPTNPFVCK